MSKEKEPAPTSAQVRAAGTFTACAHVEVQEVESVAARLPALSGPFSRECSFADQLEKEMEPRVQSSNYGAFLLVLSLFQDIESLWGELVPKKPFQLLVSHVRARRAVPCEGQRKYPNRKTPYTIWCHSHGENGFEEYHPNYVLPERPDAWNRYQKACKLEMLAVLELAVVYAVAATNAFPVLTTESLDAAQDYCSLFNSKREELQQIAQQRHEDRSKGGKSRNARLNPAREYARRLYMQRRPPPGWKSTTAAIREILPHVIAFARTHRLAVFTGYEETSIRTLRGWLKDLKEDASGRT